MVKITSIGNRRGDRYPTSPAMHVAHARRPTRRIAMKSMMIALALLLGVAAGGATLVSGQAHAQNTTWTNANSGGGGG